MLGKVDWDECQGGCPAVRCQCLGPGGRGGADTHTATEDPPHAQESYTARGEHAAAAACAGAKACLPAASAQVHLPPAGRRTRQHPHPCSCMPSYLLGLLHAAELHEHGALEVLGLQVAPHAHALHAAVLAEEVGQRVQRGVKGEGRGVQRALVHLARHLRAENGAGLAGICWKRALGRAEDERVQGGHRVLARGKERLAMNNCRVYRTALGTLPRAIGCP